MQQLVTFLFGGFFFSAAVIALNYKHNFLPVQTKTPTKSTKK